MNLVDYCKALVLTTKMEEGSKEPTPCSSSTRRIFHQVGCIHMQDLRAHIDPKRREESNKIDSRRKAYCRLCNYRYCRIRADKDALVFRIIKNAKYMTMDIGNFYLNMILDQYENTRININDIPQEVIDEYKLYEHKLVLNGFVYVELRKALFGLKQSHALANKQLSNVLGKEGYYQSEHTSSLWLHKTRDTSFTLVVD